MKKDIHPAYHPKATYSCACGNNMEIGSTQEKVSVEICSACHPFYTGVQKVIKTGRVDRFRKLAAKAEEAAAKAGPGKKAKRVKRNQEDNETGKPETDKS